jgi:hypothetical protein
MYVMRYVLVLASWDYPMATLTMITILRQGEGESDLQAGLSVISRKQVSGQVIISGGFMDATS